MALINCPDCGRKVSDRAVACIHCGAPIAAVASNNQSVSPPSAPTQVRRTGGAWEGVGFVLIVVGLIMSMAASGTPAALGGVLLVSGFIVFIVGRCM